MDDIRRGLFVCVSASALLSNLIPSFVFHDTTAKIWYFWPALYYSLIVHTIAYTRHDILRYDPPPSNRKKSTQAPDSRSLHASLHTCTKSTLDTYENEDNWALYGEPLLWHIAAPGTLCEVSNVAILTLWPLVMVFLPFLTGFRYTELLAFHTTTGSTDSSIKDWQFAAVMWMGLFVCSRMNMFVARTVGIAWGLRRLEEDIRDDIRRATEKGG